LAYGNWGGRAYRNGEHQPAHEDSTPHREGDVQAGYWQAFGRREGLDPHHVSLGAMRLRLCAYKSFPVLYVDGEKVSLDPYTTERMDDLGFKTSGYGEIDGYRFAWVQNTDPDRVNLMLIEPDGKIWTGFSGYCMGAGYDDDDFMRTTLLGSIGGEEVTADGR
jgi:hypothetical protein